ncbi:hypothetical protein FGG08_006149 [Glutinoglossum americanum]|uniref:Methyltransferase n=1 Tax=Glutinoglossum americanum TaxID=1670608 RepID=A0A9P8I418_9PEZI|nr:hypothetical protein FGG08_006149 [Glutinoglossum americanum]
MATTDPVTDSSPSISGKPVHHDAATPAQPLPPHGPVTASLSFYTPPSDGSAPYNYVEPQPAGHPQRNYTDTVIPVPLTDIRGRESEFTLDADAFAAISGVPAASPAVDFSDDQQIRTTYYAEVEGVVRAALPGATRIEIFDHTVRRSQPGAARAPVSRVHIDQTARSAAERVRLHLPAADAAALLRSARYRVLNVWRALNPPVHSPPLAFASARSVAPADVVPVQHRYPARVGETAGVRFGAAQRWFYWSGMGEGERLLLLCFDSEGGGGRRVPHSAFEDPRVGEGAPRRDSIEVRMLVFGG